MPTAHRSRRMPTAVLTLLSDFGTADAYVGIMKGVILGIAPNARIVDLTHAIPPQHIVTGALALRHAAPHFPHGTVHVAVVDPGVGTERPPIAIETQRAVLVGPDNGLLALAARDQGVHAVRRIENPALMRPALSPTFHGRDVFAPVGAHLAAGLPFAELGSEVGAFVETDVARARVSPHGIDGEVVHVDHFGNLMTNIHADMLAGFDRCTVQVTVADIAVGAIRSVYAGVDSGSPLALINSWDCLEVAVRNGSAADRLGLGVGAPVRVRFPRREFHDAAS